MRRPDQRLLWGSWFNWEGHILTLIYHQYMYIDIERRDGAAMASVGNDKCGAKEGCSDMCRCMKRVRRVEVSS